MARAARQPKPDQPEPVWTTACPDWEQRIVEGRSLIPFAPLFPGEAAANLDVMRSLRIVDAPGSPTVGESCRPWVTDYAGAIFGSYNPATGRRLISESLLLVSKKNWKSGLAASIMLTVLIRNWRRSAEFLIVAPTIEVANNSFFAARDMVRADPELSALLHVRDHIRTIEHRTMGATLKVVAANAETVSGKKAAGVLIDELWLFGKQHDAENMLREATGGLAARPEGFVIYLSTQSDEPPSGVWKDKLNFARRVRDGKEYAPWFLPVLYEFPPAMLAAEAWRDERNWHVTNPNLGLSVDPVYLRKEFQKAAEASKESLRGFVAKHFNVQPGIALQSDRWPGAVFWLACARADGLTLDDVIGKCDALSVGIDAGGPEDWMGLCVLGREAGSRRWLAWCHAWVHQSALDHYKAESEKWRDFEREGDLTIVDEVGPDVDELVRLVALVYDTGNLIRVGLDPNGSAKVLHEALIVDGGVPEELFIGIGQGWKLIGIMKLVERRLAGKTLLHSGSSMMTYCVGNARVEERGNATLITKQASKGKIDPLMSLLDAAECLALARPPVDPDTMIAPV